MMVPQAQFSTSLEAIRSIDYLGMTVGPGGVGKARVQRHNLFTKYEAGRHDDW